MYNLSKIMTNAWKYFRAAKGNVTFGYALKKAWKSAKEQAQRFVLCTENVAKETAKALMLKVQLTCFVTDQVVTRSIWIPKSQISDNTIPAWLFNAKCSDLRNSVNYNASLQLEGFVEGFITI